MEERNVEAVRRLWTEFERGGVDAVVALTTPEVEWVPFGGRGRVLQALAEVAAQASR
jgi:ketosteroid isomerase-like protein